MSQPPAPPRRVIWWNGTLVPWAEAQVHLLSHSLQRGSLVFDYLSVHETPRGTALFRLREHVERFLHSTQLVGLPLELSADEIQAAAVAAVRANPGARAVKICALLPSLEVDVVPMDQRVTVAVAAYDPFEDVIRRNPGTWPVRPTLRLWIEKERRNRRDDILPPQAKVAANYTSPMAAKWAARRRGYDDILLVDEEGFLAEAPTANFFWVDAEGTLFTPPEAHVLHGITRRSVLEIAKHDGIAAAERRIRPAELLDAAEVFVTGTTAGVWPVSSVDDRTIGDGEPGPLTRRLRERLDQVTSGGDPAFASWLTVVDAG